MLGSQGLILTPLFSIDVTESSDFTQVKIQNIGMTQAKNSIVHVISTVPLNMTNNICVEISNIQLEEKHIEYFLDKFSTGITCTLDFQGKIKYNLEHIIVTSDDARGSEWNPVNDLITKLTIIQLTLYGMLGSASLALATIGLSFYRKRQMKSNVKKYTTKEEKVMEEIKIMEDELNSLQNSLSMTSDSTLINSLNGRIHFLDDRIRILNLELEQAKSSISLEGRSDAKVGEFFINWAELEQQINRIAERENIDTLRMNLSNIIRELQRKEIFSGELIENLHSARKFRNGLVHGFTKPEEKELELQIDKVKTLLNTIKNLNSNL